MHCREPNRVVMSATGQKLTRAHNEELHMSAASQARTVRIASAIWAGSIFLSRIMGLVREQVIGRTLGASRQTDLYFASFTLPDFLNYLLAAGALSIVFIPIFLEYLERGDEERGWEAFSVVANFVAVTGHHLNRAADGVCTTIDQHRGARLYGPSRSGHAGTADAHCSAGAVLPYHWRTAICGTPGA